MAGMPVNTGALLFAAVFPLAKAVANGFISIPEILALELKASGELRAELMPQVDEATTAAAAADTAAAGVRDKGSGASELGVERANPVQVAKGRAAEFAAFEPSFAEADVTVDDVLAPPTDAAELVVAATAAAAAAAAAAATADPGAGMAWVIGSRPMRMRLAFKDSFSQAMAKICSA